jgi:hypothetical protein
MTVKNLFVSLAGMLIIFLGVPAMANAQTPEEMARIFAIAVNRDTVRFPPGSPISFDGAAAQKNHVFIKYLVSGADMFASFKSGGEGAKATTAKHICEGADYKYLKSGVEIHWVYTLIKPVEKFEFVVNQQSCTQKLL